jgi:hypothetical protein
MCGSRPQGFQWTSDAFIPNVGQVVSLTGEKVHYFASVNGGRVYFLDNRVAFVFDGFETDPRTGEEVLTHAFRTDLTFAGAARPELAAGDRASHTYNYYLGDLRAENVPVFESLTYRNVWPGVDAVFRLKDGALKYDFVLAPGVSHQVVKIRYTDYQSLRLNAAGELVLTFPGGELREAAPTSCVLSQKHGQKLCLETESGYRLAPSGEISFRIKGRNKNDVLIIDPLVRARATFYGGTAGDAFHAVVMDGEQSVVAAGYTRSTNNYLTQNGHQNVQRGLSDMMIVKFDANGARRWATFLGGQGDDMPYAIAADGAGNVYVAGSTRGQGFPEFNGAQTTGLGNEDAVLCSFAPNGALRFSGRFGGSASDRALGVAFDNLNQRVLVVGNTSSSDLFLRTNAYSGNRDGFAAAFDQDGAALWSTYIGGERDDRSAAVAVDNSGKAYIVGGTASNALPGVAGNYQPQNNGSTDAYLSVIGDDGSILRTTFFGGSDMDEALSVSLGSARIAVVGRTRSQNIPVSGDARQLVNNGGGDGFFALFDYELSGVPYSTYLGGTGFDEFTAVRMRGSRAYLGGSTLSTDFPVLVDNVSPPNQNSNAGLQDGVLVEFTLTGSSPALTNAFYYGGARNDGVAAIDVGATQLAVAGATRSINLPVNLAQPPFGSFKGVEDGFVAVYNTTVCPVPAAITMTDVQFVCDSIRLRFSGGAAPYTVVVLDPGGTPRTLVSNSAGRVTFAHSGSGFYDLISILDNDLCVGDPNAGDGGFSFNADSLLRVTVDSVDNNLCAGDGLGAIYVSVQGGTPPYSFAWSGPGGFVSFNEDPSGLATGQYSLTVTDAEGCTFSVTDTVSEPPALVAAIVNNITQLTCANPTGILNSTVSGGVPPYQITWQGPDGFTATGGDAEVSQGGAYTLFVSDANGCAANASTLVAADFGTLSLDASTTATSCGAASDGTLTAFPTGGAPPYQVTVTDTAGNVYPFTPPFVYNNLPPGTYRVTVRDAQQCQRSLIRQVLVGQGTLNVEMSGSAVPCFGDLTGTVRATVVGGTPPYFYIWRLQNNEEVEAGPEFHQLDNRPAGAYFVTVRDAAGCEVYGNFTVTQPDAPLTVNVSALTHVRCFGQSTGAIQIHVAGGASAINYSVQWTGPNGFTSTDTTLNNLAAGQYSVVVVDANGCTANTTVTVTQPAAPMTINFGQIVPSICGGDGGAVLINPTGGVPPYSYLWTTGATTQNLSNVAAGQYGVTVTDANGCVASENYVVGQLGTTLFASSTNPVDATCFGVNNGSVSVVAAGGQPPYSYTWRRDGQPIPLIGPSLINIPGGEYSVTVTDAYGCTFDISPIPVRQRTQINVAEVDITPTSCAGGGDAAIVLNGITGGNYPGETLSYRLRWAFGDTVIVFDNVSADSFAFNSTGTAVEIGAGTYVLTIVALSPDSCSRTWTLTIPSTPAVTATVVVNDASGCGVDNYGSVVVTPTGGLPDFQVRLRTLPGAPASYDLTLPPVVQGSSASFTQTPPGFYEYRVDDASGCVYTDTVFVGSAAYSFDVETLPGTCASQSDGAIRVSGAQQADYFLYRDNTTLVGASPSVFEHNFSGLPPGNYTVVARTANDCFGTQTVTLTSPELVWQTRLTQPASCNYSNDGRILLLATGANDMRYIVRRINTENTDTLGPQIGGVFNVPAGQYAVRAYRLAQALCFIEDTLTVDFNVELVVESVEANIQTCSGSNNGAILIDASTDPQRTLKYSVFRRITDEEYEFVAESSSPSFNQLPPGTYRVLIQVVPDAGEANFTCIAERSVEIEVASPLTLTLNPDVLVAERCSPPYNFGSFSADLDLPPPFATQPPSINYDLYSADSLVMNLGNNLQPQDTFSDQTVPNLYNIPPGEYYVRATVADGLLQGCFAQAKLVVRPFIAEPITLDSVRVTKAYACGYDNTNGNASGEIGVSASGTSNLPGAGVYYRLESTDGFIVRDWQTSPDFQNLLPANYIVRVGMFGTNPVGNCDADISQGCSVTGEVIHVGIRAPQAIAPLNNGYSVNPTQGIATYPTITTPNLWTNRARIYWRAADGQGGFVGGIVGQGGSPLPPDAFNVYRIGYRLVGSGPAGWVYVVIPNANATETQSSGDVLWWDLTGLQPGQSYEYRIQTRSCGSSEFTTVSTCGPQTGSTNVGGIFSDWASSPAQRFTTFAGNACDTVAQVIIVTDVINATNIVADVSWPVDQPTATCYVLELAYEGSPATLRREAVPSQGQGVQTYRFVNLEEGTDYEVRVYTICGGPCPSSNNPPPAGTPRRVQSFMTPLLRASSSALTAFTVYPNPNKGEFTLSFASSEPGTAKLTLTDAIGRVVYEAAPAVERGQNVFQLSEKLSRGLYLLRMSLGNSSHTAKIVVE